MKYIYIFLMVFFGGLYWNEGGSFGFLVLGGGGAGFNLRVFVKI